MTLSIKKLGDKYEAEATPPHSRKPWRLSAPLPLRQLIDQLEAQGCHQRDIGDALYEIDPDWESKLD